MRRKRGGFASFAVRKAITEEREEEMIKSLSGDGTRKQTIAARTTGSLAPTDCVCVCVCVDAANEGGEGRGGMEEGGM